MRCLSLRELVDKCWDIGIAHQARGDHKKSLLFIEVAQMGEIEIERLRAERNDSDGQPATAKD